MNKVKNSDNPISTPTLSTDTSRGIMGPTQIGPFLSSSYRIKEEELTTLAPRSYRKRPIKLDRHIASPSNEELNSFLFGNQENPDKDYIASFTSWLRRRGRLTHL